MGKGESIILIRIKLWTRDVSTINYNNHTYFIVPLSWRPNIFIVIERILNAHEVVI